MATSLIVSQLKVGAYGTRRRSVRKIKPEMCGGYVPKPMYRGSGFLAGSFPSGLVTVEGVPAEAEVRVLWRSQPGVFGDGVLVATTQSAPDGTWAVTGLSTTMRFDVVARHAGFNDVIMSDVTPTE